MTLRPVCGATLRRLDLNIRFVTKVLDSRLALQNMMTVSKIRMNNISLSLHTFSDRNIVLRGCSSKRKMFHIECESHLSGTRNEQFCYCGYDLCNAATSERVNGKVSVTVILVLVCLRTFIYL